MPTILTALWSQKKVPGPDQALRRGQVEACIRQGSGRKLDRTRPQTEKEEELDSPAVFLKHPHLKNSLLPFLEPPLFPVLSDYFL